MKGSRLLCLLLPIPDSQLQPATASNLLELAEYFEMVFLEILPSG